MKYIPYKDLKAFLVDLKIVYSYVNEEVTMNSLMSLRDELGKKYPNVVSSWEDNRDNLSAFFAFPDNIRKIIYITNII